MNLSNFKQGLHLVLEENRVNVLVIENQRVLVNIIEMLRIQNEGNAGDFVIAADEKVYPFHQIARVILEPFSLDFNEKKMQMQLFQEIKEEINDSFFVEWTQLQQRMIQYLDEVLLKVPYPVIYAENIDINAFLKMVKVSLEKDGDGFLEKIVQYIRILSALCGVKVIFFLHLKMFLSEEELRALYQEAAYQKIQLVLIESIVYDKIENEDVCIIDQDMCIIQA